MNCGQPVWHSCWGLYLYLLNHALPQPISQLVLVHCRIPFLFVQMCRYKIIHLLPQVLVSWLSVHVSQAAPVEAVKQVLELLHSESDELRVSRVGSPRLLLHCAPWPCPVPGQCLTVLLDATGHRAALAQRAPGEGGGRLGGCRIPGAPRSHL